MVAISLKVNDNVYNEIMCFLNSLSKKDVEILYQKKIEEIEPYKLSKNDFDYISEESLKEIDLAINEAKKNNFSNLKSFDELKNEL